MADKFHVLLVEHDSNNHDKTLKMLHYFSYEVTSVKLASNALSILSKEKVKFDLVMANLDSPDSCGFQLLQDVVKRDLLLILMSNDDDSVMITTAIEQGAFLCIKKPVTMQIVGYLWQHVLREKVRRDKENERTLDEVIEFNNIEGNQEFGNLDNHIEGNLNNNNNNDAQERNKSKKKANAGSFTLQNDNVVFKKKVWAEWSEELHQKFMVAAIQLGEGRCYPKEILELMNVPGLTRMQVASHLQKCRNAKWLPHGGRKYKPINTETTNDPNKLNKVRRSKTERFGSMPHLDNYSQFHYLSQKSEQEMNHHKFIETSVLENSDEVFLPQLMLDRHSNYPLSEHIETFNNMGHLGPQTFGVEDVTDATPSDDVTNDVTNSMFQIFSSLQHELGTEYVYNGSLQSLVVNASAVNLNNHMPMKTNAAGEWNEEEPESMNEEQI